MVSEFSEVHERRLGIFVCLFSSGLLKEGGRRVRSSGSFV